MKSLKDTMVKAMGTMFAQVINEDYSSYIRARDIGKMF